MVVGASRYELVISSKFIESSDSHLNYWTFPIVNRLAFSPKATLVTSVMSSPLDLSFTVTTWTIQHLSGCVKVKFFSSSRVAYNIYRFFISIYDPPNSLIMDFGTVGSFLGRYLAFYVPHHS